MTPTSGQSYSVISMGAGTPTGAAGPSTGLPGPGGLPGASAGLPGPSAGSSSAQYPESPPPYESIDSNVSVQEQPQDELEQQANIDSKITEWAHREMQLSDDSNQRL